MFIVVALISFTDPPVTPPILYRMFAILVVLPFLGASIVRRTCSAIVNVHDEDIVLRGKAVDIRIRLDAIERVVAWTLPLPGPGFSLRLSSGKFFAYGLQLDEPRILQRIGARGALPQQPALAYADAKAQRQRRRWYHHLGRYAAFALLPASVLFYTHQNIAYGGLFGEYYQLGLRAYLTTLAIYWSTLIIYLVLYGGVWRAAVEVACLSAAWLATSHSNDVRRIAERLAQIGYYAGVPLLLGLRYLPW